MYAFDMEKKKKPVVKSVTAVHVLEAITHSPRLIDLTPKTPPKRSAANSRDRGLKSGKARAGKASTKGRVAIAKSAAKARRKKG